MTKPLQKIRCDVCGKEFPVRGVIPESLVRSTISELIRKDHSTWNENSYICLQDNNQYRSRYIQNSLEDERGELTNLEQQVITSLREHEILTENINQEFEKDLTFGEKIADKVAMFGGSWTFIGIFSAIIICWIFLNTLLMQLKPFDPYPFILLNLILSCLAALQAPIIMMSQNRQSSKDRLQAEHDYRVNLKAELEIRHLHSKIDLLLTHQWQRLLEIQQLQTDLLEEIAQKRIKHN